jgi:colicin import membrane protein
MPPPKREGKDVFVGNKKFPVWVCRCKCDDNHANRMFCRRCGDRAPVRVQAEAHRLAGVPNPGPTSRAGKGSGRSFAQVAMGGDKQAKRIAALQAELAEAKRAKKQEQRPSGVASRAQEAANWADQAEASGMSKELVEALRAEAEAALEAPPEPKEAYVLFGQASQKHAKAMAALRHARTGLEKADEALAAARTRQEAAATKMGELEVEVAVLKAESDRAAAAYTPSASPLSSLLGSMRPEVLADPGVAQWCAAGEQLLAGVLAGLEQARASAAQEAKEEADRGASAMEADTPDGAAKTAKARAGPPVSFIPSDEEAAPMAAELGFSAEQLKRAATALEEAHVKRARAAGQQRS